MNVQNRIIYETLLIGLRDEITQSYEQNMKVARHIRCDILNGPVAEGRLGEESSSGELDLLNAKDREQIRKIDKALYRLKSDSYNICECCNGTISEKRLNETILPWPTICLKCETAEKKQEKGNHSFPIFDGVAEEIFA